MSSERAIRVAIVGGLTRATRDWEVAGEEAGIVVEHHDGNTSGNRATAIARMIGRADVVIAITIPNSHAGVAIARRAAHTRGCPFVLMKRLAPQALADIARDAVARAA